MPRRRISLAVAASVVVTALAAGCTGGSTPGAGRSSPSSASASAGAARTASPTPEPDLVRLADAKLLAAQYDYEAALQLLADDISAQARQLAADIAQEQARAVPWPKPTEVSHLFYHSLIVDPARAFAPNESGRRGYAAYMVTLHEFQAQLEQIHQRGFVMVHPQRLVAKDAAGVMTPQILRLPPGKTPFVLSVDDVSYYAYMNDAGFASNLTLKDGRVTNTYVDAAGATQFGSFDVSTVVDDFVREHPDFAYRGDKGSIALTGYNGILGYRTSVREYGDSERTRSEQRKAKAVADVMREQGWHFASHTWGHINMTTSSLGRIQADTARWEQEVRPLVGPTDELIFPFGADIAGAEKYTMANPKFALLHGDAGFNYFFPIDASTLFWSQLGPQYWRQARINVDGISMQRELDGATTPLRSFFDTRSTIDKHRPLPLP